MIGLRLSAGVLCLAATTFGASPNSLMLLVNKQAHSVTVYDHATNRPICTASVGVNPHEVAASNDGQLIYVPIYGTTAVGVPGTDEHTLYIIKTSDCSQQAVIDTGDHKRLHGIYVGSNNLIYVTAEVSQSLVIIDPAQRKVLGAIPTGSSYSHMIAVKPDLSRAYVSNVQSKNVSVLDIPDRKLLKQIPTEGENQRMVLSPDQQWFVTNLGDAHKVAFFRTSDDSLDFAVPVDGSPFVSRFSPDGKYVYTAGYGKQGVTVWKIDVAQKKPVAALYHLGSSIGTLAIGPNGNHLYLSDQSKDWVQIISIANWAPEDKIHTARGPDEIVFTTVK